MEPRSLAALNSLRELSGDDLADLHIAVILMTAVREDITPREVIQTVLDTCPVPDEAWEHGLYDFYATLIS